MKPRIITNLSNGPSSGHRPPFHLPFHIWSATVAQRKFLVTHDKCVQLSKAVPGNILVRDLLLCSGIAQAPSTSPASYSAWGFLVEHSQSFAGKMGNIRVIQDAELWDPRVKSLFAERVGLGMATWLLWRRFDVDLIADARQFFAPTNAMKKTKFGRTYLSHGNQSSKTMPDFVCLSNCGSIVIAESKGSIGSMKAYQKSRLNSAIEQACSVKVHGGSVRAQNGRLAIATCVNYEKEIDDSGVHIWACCPNCKPTEAKDLKVNKDAIAFASYIQFLNFLDFGHVVSKLLEFERQATPVRSGTIEINGERVLMIGRTCGLRVGLIEGIAKEVFSGKVDGFHQRVAKIIKKSRLLSARRSELNLEFGDGQIDNDGVVVVLANGVVGFSEEK